MNSPGQNLPQNNFRPVPAYFYLQKTPLVAEQLLGKGLFLPSSQGPLLAEIVETEAYLGEGLDPASHSHKGVSKRNASMFEGGGTLYVYLIYGVNHCINVVTGKKGTGEAVLIRAAKPLLGIDQMCKNRGLPLDNSPKTLKNLLNGPGKLAKAFGIDLQHDGLTFSRKTFQIVDLGKKYSAKEITYSPRIGISKAQDLHLRFFVTKSEFISKRK